jgi:hypothetical protein
LLDVLCDDEESTRRKFDDRAEGAEGSGALKKPAGLRSTWDATILSSWVTGGIPVSSSGDNGDDISTVGRLASFGDEVTIAGVNRVGTGMLIFTVDG